MLSFPGRKPRFYISEILKAVYSTKHDAYFRTTASNAGGEARPVDDFGRHDFLFDLSGVDEEFALAVLSLSKMN